MPFYLTKNNSKHTRVNLNLRRIKYFWTFKHFLERVVEFRYNGLLNLSMLFLLFIIGYVF